MRKPETIERLYLDFDGFFASVEQATLGLPENAAFVAPAAFQPHQSANRQAAVTPVLRRLFAEVSEEMATGLDCRQRLQQAEVTGRTATRVAAVVGEGRGVRGALAPFLARSMRAWTGPALKCRGKGAIFGSGVGTSLSARPHFLEPELDLDTH